MNPNHIDSLIILAKISLKEGKSEESNSYFWKAYEIDSNHLEVKEYFSTIKMQIETWLKKANYYIINNNIEMGYLWCNKALKLYPDHPEALLLRSAIFIKLNNLKESMKDLYFAEKIYNKTKTDKSLLNEKDLHRIFSFVGKENILRKNYRHSIKLFDQAIRIKSDDFDSHMQKGECLIKIKNYSEAFEVFSYCLKIKPNHKLALYKCGLIKYKIAIQLYNYRLYDKCIETLNTAISYCPNISEFFVLRAKCYLKHKKMKEAISDINHSLELKPDEAEALQMKKYFIR
jgi:tetratricopeptide (TPR) repeat protein